MPEDLPKRAQGLVDSAAERGLVLRLIGSVAVRHHCAASATVSNQLGREIPMDVDLVGFVKQYRETDALFKSLHYEPESARTLGHEYGIQRLIYYAPATGIKVDIFLDVLRMSHTIDFKKRLGESAITVAPVDLLLAKLQVFRITEKDIKDIAAIMLVHDLESAIDVPYLLGLVRQDWGLCYTASRNLALVDGWLENRHGLEPGDASTVRSRLATLRGRIVAEPKSLRWRLRAAVGPRIPWYEEVGEVER